ncbi:MAG: rod shape-determining protein MreD [Coriobacteriales bacterium]|nr:rod shape-determining protein MreD [Coriobacteriales bacterium]
MQINDARKSKKNHIALALVCLLLQVMASPNIGMGNGRINFALIYAGVYALSVGGRRAVVAGFFAGLLYDALSTGPFGVMSSLLTILSFALGLEERNRFIDGFVPSLSAFGVGSLLVQLFYHITLSMLGDGASMVDIVLMRVLPAYAITFVCFLPFAYYEVRKGSGTRGKHAGGKSAGLRENYYDLRNL